MTVKSRRYPHTTFNRCVKKGGHMAKANDQEALNPKGEADNTLTESPTEEKTPEEVLEPEAKVEESSKADVKGEETHTEDKPVVPKKGAKRRIKQLLEEKKQLKDENLSLAEQVAELTGAVEEQPVAPVYQPQVEPGKEVSIEQYKQDVAKTANSIVDLKLKQERIINRVNTEANQAMAEYPELNPNNDRYNAELSETVTEAAMAYIKSNPTGSLKKFVDKLMKPYKKAVTKEVGQATENIAKQVSQTAIRPTPAPKGEKKFEDLSIPEMEERLGVVY